MDISKNLTQAHHIDLLEVCSAQHRYLNEVKDKDGFTLSNIVISDVTDEELDCSFEMSLGPYTASYFYSLGYDEDQNAYLPYVEVCVGKESDPLMYENKMTCDPCGQENLPHAMKTLGDYSGDARFLLFQFLATQPDCPAPKVAQFSPAP